MSVTQWVGNEAAPWLIVNELLAAIEGAFLYARDKDNEDGLNWHYFGGVFKDSAAGASFTLLADNTTNYIVAHQTTGAITDATTTTNWNDDATYMRVAKVTTLSGVITESLDYRFDEFGLFPMMGGGGTGSGATEFKAIQFTSDTGSTADSDPGAGLFKWNNATQASATFLYFDNSTLDSVTITTFFAALFPGGFLHLQQSDDDTKWQIWRIVSIASASGYYKFGVTLIASAGSIADDTPVYCDFKSGTKLVYSFALSDETTTLTAGTSKLTWRVPHAMTLTENPRISVNTAPTGATLVVDINEAGSTILSTKVSIDISEKTSTTAATPAVLSDTSLADDAEITFDIDQVGSTIAGAGLKCSLIGFAT